MIETTVETPTAEQIAINVAAIVQRLRSQDIPLDNEQLPPFGAFTPFILALIDQALTFKNKYKDDEAKAKNKFEYALSGMRGIQPAFSQLLDRQEPQEDTKQEKDAFSRTFTGKKTGKIVFKTLSMGDIKKLPRAEWLLPGLYQKVSVSMTYGDANTGKTFVDLDIALHLAYGKSYQGRNVKESRVLYVYGEGNEGLASRVEAWQTKYNLPDTENIQFICFPVQLMTEFEILSATMEEMEGIPAFVVLDTFSVCAEGIEENNNVEVAKFIACAAYIKRTYKTHVHIIHHAGKNGDYRGAAAFRGNVDTMVLLSRETKTSPIDVVCKKQKDAPYFDDFRLQLEVIDLGIDEETYETITSCVVIPCDSETKENTLDVKEKMIEALDALGARASFNQWKKVCVDADIAKPSSFLTHCNSLVESEKVIKISEGKGKKTWYELPSQTTSTNYIN